jgi:hypothetical protein
VKAVFPALKVTELPETFAAIFDDQLHSIARMLSFIEKIVHL